MKVPNYDPGKLKETLLSAGAIVSKYYKGPELQVDYKTADQPVTVADTECSRYLESALQTVMPNTAVCSEEGDNPPADFELLWMIDPIDGTRAFIEGIPEFAISIGLANKTDFLLGAVYNPVNKFLAIGDVENGITTCENSPQKNSLNSIAVSRSELKDNLFSDLNQPGSPYQLDPINSIAYKLALLATGSHDLVISRRPKHIWDVAGGLALLSAANYTFELDSPENIQCGLYCQGLIAGKQKSVDEYKSFIDLAE